MASEFMADATERIILALQSLGVSRETAGMVAAEWQAGVEQDWGGERPYIGKGGTAERALSRRDADIVRQFSAFLIQIYRERAGAFRAFMLASLTDETVRRERGDRTQDAGWSRGLRGRIVQTLKTLGLSPEEEGPDAGLGPR